MQSYPFGYRYELAPFGPEQEVIRRIGNLYFVDRISQYEIAKILNQEGVMCRGRPWHQGTISRILKREFPKELRAKREHVLRKKPTWRDRARQRAAGQG